MYFQTQAWDAAVFALVNQDWRTPFLDWLMPVLSLRWIWAALAVVCIPLALRKLGTRRTILSFALLLLSIAAAENTCQFIKKSIGRPRPLNALPAVHYHEDGEWRVRPADFAPPLEKGNSYPSAHAANSMALALLAAMLWPALRPWALLAPLGVGYSRMYLAKHYPSDVLAGWLLGVGVALLLWVLWRSSPWTKEYGAQQSAG